MHVKFANERKAMGHYRLASPFLALCLVIVATTVMLHGRILRETVNRRILIVALTGILIQAGLILSRSLTASTPLLWPSLYLVVFVPMIFGFYLLAHPTAFCLIGQSLGASLLSSHQEADNNGFFSRIPLTLFVYMSMKYAKILLLTLLVLISFITFIEIIELLRRAGQKAPDLSSIYIVFLGITNIPTLLDAILPFAVLLVP